MKYLPTAIAICTFCISFFSYSAPLDQLDKRQINDLKQGEVILIENQRKDLPWPQVEGHLKFEVSPLDALAIYTAFDIQKDYVPNLIESSPIEVRDVSKVFVRYEMNLPWPIPNNRYIHGHELIKRAENDYEVTWWMVESNSAKKVEGSARFYLSDDQTYMHYQSLVVPDSTFASLLKNSMLSDVRESLKVIRLKTHEFSKNQPKFMQEYRDLLIQTFQNKPAWKQKITKSQRPQLGDSNKDD
jgi:hypothetical protein